MDQFDGNIGRVAKQTPESVTDNHLHESEMGLQRGKSVKASYG